MVAKRVFKMPLFLVLMGVGETAMMILKSCLKEGIQGGVLNHSVKNIVFFQIGSSKVMLRLLRVIRCDTHCLLS